MDYEAARFLDDLQSLARSAAGDLPAALVCGFHLQFAGGDPILGMAATPAQSARLLPGVRVRSPRYTRPLP
jgi:hypothetical protein